MSALGATITAPASSQTSDDDLDHYVCCDPNRTLCGLDATEIPWIDDITALCVVCEDLNQQPCDCTQPQSGNPA